MSEIGVKLTGDNSEYRSMLSDSVDRGAEFGGKLVEKVGDKLYGLRDVSHVVANALGLNLEHIAENLARVYANLSEEEQKAYEEADRLSDENAALTIKNARALASEETRYQLLLGDRARAQKEISDAEGAAASRSIDTARVVFDTEKGFRIDTDRDIQLSGEERKKVELANRTLIETNAEIARIEAAKRLAEAKAELDVKLAQIKTLDDFQKGLDDDAALRKKTADSEQRALLEGEAKINQQIFDDLVKQSQQQQTLIAQAHARSAAEASVLSEFEQQLVAIQKMAGAGTAGFKAGPGGGGQGTVTQQQLEDALANAKTALNFAERTANGPDGARNLLEAQAAVQQAQSNRDIGRGQQGFGGPRAVNISDLDFSSVSSVADAALGTRQSAAATKALADAQAKVGYNTNATAQAVRAIHDGLVKGRIIDGGGVEFTGSGGAPTDDTGGGLLVGLGF